MEKTNWLVNGNDEKLNRWLKIGRLIDGWWTQFNIRLASSFWYKIIKVKPWGKKKVDPFICLFTQLSKQKHGKSFSIKQSINQYFQFQLD